IARTKTGGIDFPTETGPKRYQGEREGTHADEERAKKGAREESRSPACLRCYAFAPWTPHAWASLNKSCPLRAPSSRTGNIRGVQPKQGTRTSVNRRAKPSS